MLPNRRGWRPRAADLALAAAVLLAGSCRGGTPRIGFPEPWLGHTLGRVAQSAIDAWGQPRVAELAESLPPHPPMPPGYGGDVAFAEATAEIPDLVAVAGPLSSRATLLAAPVYVERRIPLIAPTATSSLIGTLGPWVFQLAPDDHAEGAFMADFALDRLHARRVTVFYLLSDEYGLGLRDGVVSALRRRGVVPVDQAGIIEQSDFPRRVAESLRRARPDVVLVAARGREAAAIARSLDERLPRTPVIVGDGAPLDAGFFAAAGPAAAFVYGVAWWVPDLPDSASRDFVARWAAWSGGVPTASEAMYYDAVMLAAEAVREAGPSRSAVRRWLSGLGTARPPYRGVTGPISFVPGRAVNLLMTARSPEGSVAVVQGPGEGR
jgi:ABC-type branched-subunit amino acid transport system substrate-binding protein